MAHVLLHRVSQSLGSTRGSGDENEGGPVSGPPFLIIIAVSNCDLVHVISACVGGINKKGK